jgi:hypothetical protein
VSSARDGGLFNEIQSYRFSPENGLDWTGIPLERPERFAEIASDQFHIAVDLRVDPDTRHLLAYVHAELRCDIGNRMTFPIWTWYCRAECAPAILRRGRNSWGLINSGHACACRQLLPRNRLLDHPLPATSRDSASQSCSLARARPHRSDSKVLPRRGADLIHRSGGRSRHGWHGPYRRTFVRG